LEKLKVSELDLYSDSRKGLRWGTLMERPTVLHSRTEKPTAKDSATGWGSHSEFDLEMPRDSQKVNPKETPKGLRSGL